ncbi:hypothetical protein AXG93_461s1180 [Marchantia polymorpha subsp. ruderalis]|uniref:Nucleotide-diphospho-sugar transferase domain-containing protein n=1 Tax=Marchantia polymorpha subsp. ruderalis TaxID=1480154 RepID=A0A176VEH4_MARPO|nr:hypothetical protein AXG93_461s1180 [Marchantia polymorpha subsp. ruderalis]
MRRATGGARHGASRRVGYTQVCFFLILGIGSLLVFSYQSEIYVTLAGKDVFAGGPKLAQRPLRRTYRPEIKAEKEPSRWRLQTPVVPVTPRSVEEGVVTQRKLESSELAPPLPSVRPRVTGLSAANGSSSNGPPAPPARINKNDKKKAVDLTNKAYVPLEENVHSNLIGTEFRLVIKLLAVNSYGALLRCLNSLKETDFAGDPVDLHIFIDHFIIDAAVESQKRPRSIRRRRLQSTARAERNVSSSAMEEEEEEAEGVDDDGGALDNVSAKADRVLKKRPRRKVKRSATRKLGIDVAEVPEDPRVPDKVDNYLEAVNPNDWGIIENKLRDLRRVLGLADRWEWKFGRKVVHYRSQAAGYQEQWIDSWWPSSDNEFALVVEDDMELSPLFYRYVRSIISTYYYQPAHYDPSLYGISLQRPSLVPDRLAFKPARRRSSGGTGVAEGRGMRTHTARVSQTLLPIFSVISVDEALPRNGIYAELVLADGLLPNPSGGNINQGCNAATDSKVLGTDCKWKNGQPIKVDVRTRLFMYEMVGIWGQVFFPKPWKEFRTWYETHKSHDQKPLLEGMVTTDWYREYGEKMWTPWFVKFVHARGYFNMYTNFLKDRVMSVTHRSESPKTKKYAGCDSDLIWSNSTYDVDIFHMAPMNTIKRYDYCFREVKVGRFANKSTDISQVLRTVHQNNEVLMLSTVNVAEPLVRNWVCSLRKLGIVNYVFFGDDGALLQDLARRGHATLQFEFSERLTEDGEKEVYAVLTALKLGYDVWFSRADMMWVGNPLSLTDVSAADMVGLANPKLNMFYIRSTNETLDAWSSFYKQLDVAVTKGSRQLNFENAREAFVQKCDGEEKLRSQPLDKLLFLSAEKLSALPSDDGTVPDSQVLLFGEMSGWTHRDLSKRATLLNLWNLDDDLVCTRVVC